MSALKSTTLFHRPQERRPAGYLLFWPVFALRYLLLEGLIPPERCQVVQIPLDDRIPFCEWFLIPYAAWYGLLVGLHLYTLRRDIPAFRRYSRFLIAAFSVSTLIFLLFPSCQNLRPTRFPRETRLTELVKLLYLADTNTNVCPSEHVIGSVGFYLAARDSLCRKRPGLTPLFAAAALLSGIATVFLKQHSVVDVLAALPVCIFARYYSLKCSR